MPEEKKLCCFKDYIDNNYSCNNEVYDKENNLCIFHCKEKPKKEIILSFRNLLESHGDNKEKLDFRYYKFPDGCKIEGLKIPDDSEFRRVTFGNFTEFKDVIFGDNVFFNCTSFFNKIEFINVIFGYNVLFSGVSFGKETAFLRTTFKDKNHISGSTFLGKILFQDVSFGNEFEFQAVTGPLVKISQSNFGRNVTFYTPKFSNQILNFYNIFIEQPKTFYIIDYNFKNIYFSQIDIKNISFINCDSGNPKRVILKNEIEEFSPGKHNVNRRYIILHNLYRDIQINFESRKMNQMAQKSYASAMEMKRLQIAATHNKIFKWLRQNIFSFVGLYKNLSYYGQDYWRAFYWLIALMFILPFLYMQFGSNLIGLDITNDYLKALELNFYIMTFQKLPKSFELLGLAKVVSVIVKGLTGIFVSFFGLALRRSFKV